MMKITNKQTMMREFLADKGFPGCGNNYFLLKNRILDEFPLTPCPDFETIMIIKNENVRDVYAYYRVDNGVKDEYELYKRFFDKKGYKFDIEELKEQSGILEVSEINREDKKRMKMTAKVSGDSDRII